MAAQAQLAGPAAASIDPLTLVALEATCLGFLCKIESEHGSSDFSAHQKRFAPLVPNDAESALTRFLLVRGDAPAARAARKRSELLSVHMHSMLETKNTEAAAYATLYALPDDLIGLRQVQDTLIEMARTRPGWRPRADLLSCHVLRCQGRIAPARALIAATLAVLDHAHVDFAAFERRAGLCAEHYAIRGNPSLAVRHVTLMRDAARSGMPVSGAWESARTSSDGIIAAALRDLAALTSDSEFHFRALELLAQSAGATAAFLYLRTAEGLRQIARTHSSSWTSAFDLDREAERYFAVASDESTRSAQSDAPVPATPQTTSDPSRELWTCPLAREAEGARVVEGVVLLCVPRTGSIRPTPLVLEELALLLTMRTQGRA